MASNLSLILDRESYQAGSVVRFRLRSANSNSRWVRFFMQVFYDGRAQNSHIGVVQAGSSTDFSDLYHIPEAAATGRYRVRLVISNGGPVLETSFAVWRTEIAIEEFQPDRRFYSPDDPIAFRVKLTNRAPRARKRLWVEVGEGQYPWIAASADTALFTGTVDLAPRETKVLSISGRCPAAEANGTVHYTAVVRDGASAQILAFRSTPPLFVRQPQEAPRPIYPPTYIHSDLSQLRVEGYRHFYGKAGGGRILDRSQTSFRADATNRITLLPSSDRVAIELRSSDGELLDRTDNANPVLRFRSPGLHTLRAKRMDVNGQVLETECLQVSANLIPRSLAILCAHPDDEFLHPAAIRAAVENGMPVHLIFLSCGDAGGSDRFFGADYTPAEAIEFGHIRIAEARAAASHLGIPAENLHFLGLPDGFLEAIRTEAQGLSPIFSPLLGTDHSPYREVVQPNLPYTRRAVLNVLTRVLGEIDPDTVYTSHPDERHADHKAAGWFTVEALKELVAAGRLQTTPALRTDQFYGSAESSPAPFVYRTHEFYSSGEAMARVQEAYWYYQSQGGNHARGHVLNYEDLPRVERHQEIVNWTASIEPANVDLPKAV
jgi:LmbE family N-acetylglucosaminyl deacetylase